MADIDPTFGARAAALEPDFELQREIGRGGMGIVYLGVDVKLDRPVAIKVLPEHLAGVAEIRERFLREARTAAKLSHPNIVPIYHADEMGGVVFFVMAYVDGESLAERIASGGALPPIQCARLLSDVALALDYAHGRGVVHRDVKPENILVERGTDHALVTDFGIARLIEAKPLTATGQVLGTVHYMSPEQISGETVDGRSDIYSLGVVGFRALTGRLPFDNEAASAVLVAHVVKAPPSVIEVSASVPRAIATVIDACLAKDPGARYASGAALAQALDEAIVAMERDGARAVVTPPVISEREAQALWARAAELQANTGVQTSQRSSSPAGIRPAPAGAAERRSLTSGYRYDDVRSAAAEAGIPERYVQRAAAEMGLAPAARDSAMVPMYAPAPSSGRAARFLGASPSIIIEHQIPGEVAESEFATLVDLIRWQIGEPGNVTTLGRSLSWSSAQRQRRLQISIVPRDGRTLIRLDERLSHIAGGLFGGIMGGMGGGSVGAAFGIGLGAMGSLPAALLIWGGAVAASYGIARTIFTVQARGKERQLRALGDQLAAMVRDSLAMHALPRGR